MSTLILAFCAPGPMRGRVEQHVYVTSWDGLRAADTEPHPVGVRYILLGVGADGCAALARRVGEDGLEGVVGVVLIDPQAGWATVDPECDRCGAHPVGGMKSGDECVVCGNVQRLPLGALEPLRAVAERARVGAVCPRCDVVAERVAGGLICPTDDCAQGYIRPLRLVIACHVERAVCRACHDYKKRFEPACKVCSGTGNALGSAEVARELVGDRSYRQADVAGIDGALMSEKHGGLHLLSYATRAALNEHAIGEALRIAMEGM